MDGSTMRVRWMWPAALGMALLLGAAACSGDGEDSGAGMAQESEGSEEESGAALSSEDSFAAGRDGGGRGSINQVDFSQPDSVFGSPKVIKNGQIELEVERGSFDDSIDDVIALATRLGGIVGSTAIDDAGERRGTVVVRVPSDRFEEALRELRDVGRIQSQYVDTQDVTNEFVDLEARIRNSRAAERVLIGLMNEAATVGDTIRVQNQLERVQENIERMRGRLRVLEDQTSFSTLSIEVVEAGAPDERTAAPIVQAWRDAIDGFIGVIAAVIAASGVVLPVAIMALVAALLARRLWPRPGREAPPAAGV